MNNNQFYQPGLEINFLFIYLLLHWTIFRDITLIFSRLDISKVILGLTNYIIQTILKYKKQRKYF
jgi:hypothetical protein